MNYPVHLPAAHRLLSMLIAASLAAPLPAQAATVALATSPLASSTTSAVKPNVLLLMDNSGSMDWDHMPDDAADGGSAVSFQFDYYGLRSSQCNQVYYDPATTYQPPVLSSGMPFPDSSFTNAWTNGFNTGAGAVNLSTNFKASQSMGGDGTGTTAYYYSYSGTQTTAALKDYNSTTNAFYQECNSPQYAAPGEAVFTRVVLSNTAPSTTATLTVSGASSTSVSGILLNGTQQLMAGTAAASTISSTVAANIAAQINLCTISLVGNCNTAGGHGYTAAAVGSTVTISGLSNTASTLSIARSGTMTFSPAITLAASSAQLTNFANWYSYYRTRMLMMKTATGRAFSGLNNNYRVGLKKYSQITPVVYVDTFDGTHRDNWYTTLYGMTSSGSTPSRTALSDAGRYYAGKLAGTDPIQYSCQQNFTILSTDGYWNTGDGYQVDGSTAVGNQDGTADRPMYDGATTVAIWTKTYTRNDYSTTTSGCSGGKRRLRTQPQIGSCDVTVATANCTPAWVNNGVSTVSGTCANPYILPSPDPSVAVLQGSVPSTAASGGSSNNLADIAMYYYMTDLRDASFGNCTGALGTDVCLPNNVFMGGNDNKPEQHMTTFTLGLGASGWMKYSSSYLSDSSGDYFDVKLGSTASATVCTWQASGTVCNWPLPGMTGSDGLIANVDDLWHAAVNGRGAYFSATNPASLSSGLSNALAGINMRKGAAAAAATSTLNPVAGNNYAYVASYTTVAWKGNLEARGINTDDGTVNENADWCVEDVPAATCTEPAPGGIKSSPLGDTTAFFCASAGAVTCPNGEWINTVDGTQCWVPLAVSCTGTMYKKVFDTYDNRTIKTADSAGTGLVDFTYASLTATQKGYFADTHIGTLTQWSSLTPAQQALAQGGNLVNYLRGQFSHEDQTSNLLDDRWYRNREAVMGDALESQPTFVAGPLFDYPYAGYSSYKSNNLSRDSIVYIGANDGMLHAFYAKDSVPYVLPAKCVIGAVAGEHCGGEEAWAYVPSMVIPNMWKLADSSYATLHTNYVNGSPIVSDICTANCSDALTAVWKTILVAGLNGGGRGYYALDITNPSSPQLLWEFTTSSGMGKITDDDVGYAFGQAVITRKQDGTWVVLLTSGYNNVSPGDGQGYLYVLDAATGTIISKIGTGAGTTTTPSGLAKIRAYNEEPIGNLAGYVYGGDLLGNVWRFDINSPVVAAVGTGDVMRFATLFDAGGVAQPVTTTPILAKINGKRAIGIGTGKYLETGDLTNTNTQSYYMIMDDDATSTFVNPRTTMVQQTIVPDPLDTAYRTAGSSNTVNFYSTRGWFVDFPDTGERVNIDGKLVEGVLIIPTIVPSNTACSPGGYGWLNYFDYLTGAITSVKYDSTIVGVNVIFIDGKPIIAAVTSTNPTPQKPKKQPDFPGPKQNYWGKRQIWRELIQ
jgi:type IV pilus assembly protein PilY1